MTATRFETLREEWLPGAGVRLHAVSAGDPAHPLVVLLHGFPEFWYGWNRQIAALAAAGLWVVALDQRGYNLSDKPARVADYAVDLLARDVTACLDALKVERAAVVGHDWGGGVAWRLALSHPERVSRLAVLNCPHPVAMQAELEGSWEQLARSWYIFAAQVPRLPERLMRADGFAALKRTMRRSSRPGTFRDEDFVRYEEAWGRPAALTSMVGWYRAAVRHPPPPPRSNCVSVPTLLIWGMRDAFLSRPLAAASAAMCNDVRVELLHSARPTGFSTRSPSASTSCSRNSSLGRPAERKLSGGESGAGRRDSLSVAVIPDRPHRKSL